MPETNWVTFDTSESQGFTTWSLPLAIILKSLLLNKLPQFSQYLNLHKDNFTITLEENIENVIENISEGTIYEGSIILDFLTKTKKMYIGYEKIDNDINIVKISSNPFNGDKL